MLFLLALVVSDTEAQQPAAMTSQMVDINGYPLHVQFSGLESRKPGSPVVVFEAGATNSLDVWSNILPEVMRLGPVVAYDRAGLGKSSWDNTTPTPRHVWNRLRQLLRAIGAEPPFVFVGYSWGGSLARYFAGYNPEEIAGLVYVDPGPIITQTLAEKLAPYDSVGAGKAGYDAFWSGFASVFKNAAPAVQAEFKVFHGLMEQELKDRDLQPAPNVPVVVIVAAKPYPPFLKLPYDQQAHFKADVRHRIKILQEWTLTSSHGTLVVSNHMSHAVPKEDPDLIVWAVRRVLDAVKTQP